MQYAIICSVFPSVHLLKYLDSIKVVKHPNSPVNITVLLITFIIFENWVSSPFPFASATSLTPLWLIPSPAPCCINAIVEL